MKRQLSAPASISPQKPMELLCNVVWLEGMSSDAVDFITSAARIKLFDAGDTITRQGEDVTGIYLIVSGMVKVRLQLYVQINYTFLLKITYKFQ